MRTMLALLVMAAAASVAACGGGGGGGGFASATYVVHNDNRNTDVLQVVALNGTENVSGFNPLATGGTFSFSAAAGTNTLFTCFEDGSIPVTKVMRDSSGNLVRTEYLDGQIPVAGSAGQNLQFWPVRQSLELWVGEPPDASAFGGGGGNSPYPDTTPQGWAVLQITNDHPNFWNIYQIVAMRGNVDPYHNPYLANDCFYWHTAFYSDSPDSDQEFGETQQMFIPFWGQYETIIVFYIDPVSGDTDYQYIPVCQIVGQNCILPTVQPGWPTFEPYWGSPHYWWDFWPQPYWWQQP